MLIFKFDMIKNIPQTKFFPFNLDNTNYKYLKFKLIHNILKHVP